jgi:hypothetical protein
MNAQDRNGGFGPGNPHPLSQLQTELVWEGKYDEFGNRRTVDVAGLAMPSSGLKPSTSRVRESRHRATYLMPGRRTSTISATS